MREISSPENELKGGWRSNETEAKIRLLGSSRTARTELMKQLQSHGEGENEGPLLLLPMVGDQSHITDTCCWKVNKRSQKYEQH